MDARDKSTLAVSIEGSIEERTSSNSRLIILHTVQNFPTSSIEMHIPHDGPTHITSPMDLNEEPTWNLPTPGDSAGAHPKGEQKRGRAVSVLRTCSVSQKVGGGMTESSCLDTNAVASILCMEHETAPDLLPDDRGGHLPGDIEVSGLRSPCGNTRFRHAQDQDHPLTSCQVSNDISPGFFCRGSTIELCPCTQQMGHAEVTCGCFPAARTAFRPLPPPQRCARNETSYPPRHANLTDALAQAMQETSGRLDDLERGAAEEEAPWMGIRSPRMGLILTILALAAMILEGGTRLYGAIHSPPT
ncbi:hypothetical protein M407DRAFT_30843 [Tulasnella calospora MUT 4182]|uniref:Uncharacterized protein n=1 Tax=Tulasnella calospora MUT 4182 TaxID=1051891 RepID=A0A0C3KDK4_9AGAM|nr:hypothetical protein M407DRAFT_30843 [Tulasnella calospora MUT 4182]